MKLKNSVKAATAAAALAFSISGAQAQYTTVPPVVSGSAIVATGGYYGPAFTTNPSISIGAPFYSPQLGGYGYGGYGFANYDTNGYGYGSLGFNGYGGPYGNGYNPYDFTRVGDVNGPTRGGTVNPSQIQGGIVDPTNPDAVPNPDGTADTGATPQRNSVVRRSPIVARRAPYSRLAIAYRGDTSNVNSITMMILDRRGREIQQEVLTAPPAATQLRVPIGSRYYRVIVAYNDGTSRTFTYPLKVKQAK